MLGSNLWSLHYNLAESNPFLYRGYYYDRETGFYYLRSRYYDPVIGRFLNADSHVNANGDLSTSITLLTVRAEFHVFDIGDKQVWYYVQYDFLSYGAGIEYDPDQDNFDIDLPSLSSKPSCGIVFR